jgi:hypothetical protein
LLHEHCRLRAGELTISVCLVKQLAMAAPLYGDFLGASS